MARDKKEPISPFKAVIDITIEVETAKKTHTFGVKVKQLSPEKFSKMQTEAKKKTNTKVGKERKKLIKSLERNTSRLETIESELYLLSDSETSTEESLKLVKKKSDLQTKIWEIEDRLEALSEGEDNSMDASLMKAEKEAKKLFAMTVIEDDGLAAFMADEEVSYFSMMQHIQAKSEEAMGNVYGASRPTQNKP